MKKWLFVLILGFAGLAKADSNFTANAIVDAEASAAVRYCYCFGSAQFHDLVYVDSGGRKNVIYTYSNRRDCEDAKARTYLCQQYSGDTQEISGDLATVGSNCSQVARYCWSSCDKAPYSCYRNCMINNGCRP